MACLPIALKGIAGSCEGSVGGIKRALIAKYEDDAFTVDDANGTVTGVSLASGNKFYEYNFKKNTGSLTSTLNSDPANGVNYVSTELVLQFSKRDSAKRLEMAALALGDLICVVEDCNGVWTALGVTESVSATAGTGQSGTAKTDGNFYSITLSDENPTFPQHLTEDAVEAVLALIG